jgi:hypothetical protein
MAGAAGIAGAIAGGGTITAGAATSGSLDAAMSTGGSATGGGTIAAGVFVSASLELAVGAAIAVAATTRKPRRETGFIGATPFEFAYPQSASIIYRSILIVCAICPAPASSHAQHECMGVLIPT